MKDIIEMAREAGFTEGIEELSAEEFAGNGVWVQDTEITERIERFADLVAAQEREECWRTAENYDTGYEAAEAIRARGTT
jgi:hypothetical protein